MGSFEKGDRGARILKLQTLLQGNPRGLFPREIARRTGVTTRTTYRDIAALESMNVPIYEDEGRIIIDPNYFVAPVKFTLREAMVLLIGVRLMHRHSDEAGPDIADALTKLAAVLAAPVAEYVHPTVRQMAERPSNPGFSRVYHAIALGVPGRQAVRIWHPSQQLSPGPEGAVDMSVTVAGTVEITPWILGWGDAVEVLAPVDLRGRIAETASRLADRNGAVVARRAPVGG